MSPLLLQVLARDFDRWRNMDAWGGDLGDVALHVTTRRTRDTLGSTMARGALPPLVTIHAGTGLAHARGTLLHELAHVAVYRRLRRRSDWNFHHPRWRAYYLDAIEEVTGRRLRVGQRDASQAIDQAAVRAIRLAFAMKRA